MAFVFAYSLDGNHAGPVVDLPQDTNANYRNTVGTSNVTKGDLVFLNAGLLKRTINAATPKASGVVEGTEFLGLVAAGQPYAAAKGSFNAAAENLTLFPNGVVKVRRDPLSVYKVAASSGQTATVANIGGSYGISQISSGEQFVDLTNTTNLLVKVEAMTPDGKFVYVTILPSAYV